MRTPIAVSSGHAALPALTDPSVGMLPAGVFLASMGRRAQFESIVLAQWTAVGVRHIDPHTHADAHFMLVTSGRYATTARGESTAPSLLIFNPAGTSHQDHLESGGAFFTVTLPPAIAADDGVAALPAAPSQVGAPGPRAVMWRLQRELARWGQDSAFHAECLCHELIAVTGGARPLSSAPGWLRRVREYLDDNYPEPVALADLSRSVGVHPHHLTRAFRASYACTPGEYLRNRRLAFAAQRLSETDQPIVAVALATGFADQPHLTRRFRSAYGVAPGRYRHLTR